MRGATKVTVIATMLLLTLSCSLVSQQPPIVPPSTTAGLGATQTLGVSTVTAVPAPTATPAPTALNPQGPYILFGGSKGIWIANPDGSYLTRLAETGIGLVDLHRALSPQGDKLAYISTSDQGPILQLLGIPDGHAQTIALLESITKRELQANNLAPRAFAYYAITMYDNVAWQPGDGHLLAFIGAQGGPTADLYTYDLATKEVKQLTDGPSQALYPNWSPDGKYIVHFGGSWVPPFGGAIAGYNQTDGAWAIRVADGKIITLPKPRGSHHTFLGWQDDSHYLIYDVDEACHSKNIHTVDIETLQTSSVFEPCFYFRAVRSPANGAILLSAEAGCAGCALAEGTYLLLPSEIGPHKLLEKKAYELTWLPESGVFEAYPEALLSADGTIRYDPPVYDHSYHPAVSKKGFAAWEVIENQQGRVVVQVPGEGFRPILDGLVTTLIWDPLAGDTLLMAMEDGSLYAAAAPDFVPHKMGNTGSRVDQAIWTP